MEYAHTLFELRDTSPNPRTWHLLDCAMLDACAAIHDDLA